MKKDIATDLIDTSRDLDECLPTLVKGIDNDCNSRQEGPSNTDSHPTRQTTDTIYMVGKEQRKRDDQYENNKLRRERMRSCVRIDGLRNKHTNPSEDHVANLKALLSATGSSSSSSSRASKESPATEPLT